MKKKTVFFITFLLLFIIFWPSIRGFFYYARSLVIMYPYSQYHHQNSLLAELSLSIEFNRSEDKNKSWFPLLLTFSDDEGFSSYIDQPVRYTVLYGFPNFDLQQAGSAYYQPESPFFSSFYGAYVIQNQETSTQPFGFNEKGLNLPQLQKLAEYDQLQLVLPSLGCPSSLGTFQVEVDQVTENRTLGNLSGWTRIDATLVTNSPLHQNHKHQRGYLQFGLPFSPYQGPDFQLVRMQGRFYVNYLPESRTTLVLYLLGQNEEFIEKWDVNLLSKVSIDFEKRSILSAIPNFFSFLFN